VRAYSFNRATPLCPVYGFLTILRLYYNDSNPQRLIKIIGEAVEVEVLFQGRKLEKVCKDQHQLTRKYGATCAKLLARRLDDLNGAENLEAMRRTLQARCHELKVNRAGTLAVDLEHPYRLIFEPAHDPIPKKADGGLDWTKVTTIRILAVEDYHG
jgi:proteic killer suppression protein